MKKVITYGTFDMLHYGHINLLKRAKDLGDYLIVGVTSEEYDYNRGKLNVSEPLVKRIENVKKTGLADKIIVEEYFGQKVSDIQSKMQEENVCLPVCSGIFHSRIRHAFGILHTPLGPGIKRPWSWRLTMAGNLQKF